MSRVEARPVMDGKSLKWTLEQVRSADAGLVRLDWLRFTVPLSAVVQRDESLPADLDAVALLDQRGRDVVREARAAETEYTTGPAVARAGALLLLGLLPQGQGYELGTVEARGMDYYAARAVILRDGAEVAHVLAGGRQVGQAGTVHFNLFGACMLKLTRPDYARIHGFVSSARGWITRVDLALDVFEGADICEAQTAYLGGLFDVRGKRPGQREHGSWTSGHSRTFEVGSRETGKLCRVYEKGDEIFGPDEHDPWVRYEVEIRNQNRIIDLDVLIRPADFFAGAYTFTETILSRANAEFAAARIPVKARAVESTAEGEALRVVKWFKNTAAPTVSALLHYCGDAFETIVMDQSWRTPGRLVGWSADDLRAAFGKVAARIAPTVAPSFAGA